MNSRLETIIKIDTEKSNKIFSNYFIGINILFLITSLIAYFSFRGKYLTAIYMLQIQIHLMMLVLLLIPLKILSSRYENPSLFKLLFFISYVSYISTIVIISGRLVTGIDSRFDAFSLVLLLSINISSLIYMSRRMYLISTIFVIFLSFVLSFGTNSWMMFLPDVNNNMVIADRLIDILLVSTAGYLVLHHILNLMKGIVGDEPGPFIDELTGAYNKHFLKEKLAQMSIGNEKQLSVIAIGVDDMREINKNFGFSAGDSILQAFTNQVQKITRQSDSVCRVEGDKLTIIVQHPEDFKVEELAERIRQNVEKEKYNIVDKNSEQVEANITVSLGVATLKEGESSDGLLVRAEKALKEAKEKGKNRVKKS